MISYGFLLIRSIDEAGAVGADRSDRNGSRGFRISLARAAGRPVPNSPVTSRHSGSGEGLDAAGERAIGPAYEGPGPPGTTVLGSCDAAGPRPFRPERRFRARRFSP
jgi:hypothetical protein